MADPHPLMAELAEHRRTQGRSQLDVACQLGVVQGTVCFWETGQRTPTLAHAAALADELGYRLTLTPKETL